MNPTAPSPLEGVPPPAPLPPTPQTRGEKHPSPPPRECRASPLQTAIRKVTVQGESILYTTGRGLGEGGKPL